MLGGLPRSGSTLICNLLMQNPEVHSTATSGMMDICFGVRNNWNNLIEHKSQPETIKKLPVVLNSMMHAYYEDVERPIVVDKCRGWVSLIEMAEHALNRKVKVIVPVRDLREVVSSFEKLYRKQAETGQVPGEQENYFAFQTVEGRVNYWLRNDQPVGLAFNRIKAALDKGLADRMHFVDFDVLTSEPEKAMSEIYDFLGLERFSHDFENIEQVTKEDDSVHGFAGLHDIQPKIQKKEHVWQDIIGDVGTNLEGAARFWERN